MGEAKSNVQFIQKTDNRKPEEAKRSQLLDISNVRRLWNTQEYSSVCWKAHCRWLIEVILLIFKESRNNYGMQKKKDQSEKKSRNVSRRQIGRIIKEEGLVSNYTVTQVKPAKSPVNGPHQKWVRQTVW